MPVAEEVHFLYPESEWALSRLAEDPAHLLFKRFGEQVPKADWNHPGTKQGIYLMGPNGEYLEGAHASSGHADRLVERMERALKRWKALAKASDYAQQPVPSAGVVAPPEVLAAPLGLRVFLRDLPRGKRDDSGRRVRSSDLLGKGWMHFTEWAWNQNWLTLDEAEGLLPADLEATGGPGDDVDAAALQHIARFALIDNVRGQNPPWAPEDVQSVELKVVVVSAKGGERRLEYRGHAELSAEGKTYSPSLEGHAVWDVELGEFRSFQLLAVGLRSGAARFNQRAADQGPAPMGVLLELVPSPESPRVERSGKSGKPGSGR